MESIVQMMRKSFVPDEVDYIEAGHLTSDPKVVGRARIHCWLIAGPTRTDEGSPTATVAVAK